MVYRLLGGIRSGVTSTQLFKEMSNEQVESFALRVAGPPRARNSTATANDDLIREGPGPETLNSRSPKQ